MPGTSNLFEIMCPEKIRPSGCLDSSRYVPDLDLCSFYSFPSEFTAFLSPALEMVGYSTELAHLLGGWGGEVGCKEGELVSACSRMGIATPVPGGRMPQVVECSHENK